MNVKYAKHDGAGRILFCGEVPKEMIELQGDDIWVGEANPRTDYIVAGECVARPISTARLSRTEVKADSTDEIVLVGVPAGAELRVTGPSAMSGIIEAGGDVELTFALPGDYTLELCLFPFQDLKVMIHAI